MTNPARCAKGGAPPRRADAETNAEDCRQGPAANRESLKDGWERMVACVRVNGPVVRRKLDVGGIPTDTGVDKRRRALAMQASNTRFQIL
ncbi:hypothetical protein KXW24_004865 [Aspergillus fumigatus]|nr:hypothetical protein KXX39_003918 [Aspergillus fumigatus]KAH3508905.1 hypothetical protein KXW24_004865 [Aspergillus fumigatus]